MKQIIDGVRYDTEKSVEIANNCYWDGHSWDRSGRETRLYKTPNGRFFACYRTRWEGEQDRIAALTSDEAKKLYEQLSKSILEFEDVFDKAPIEG